MKLFVFSFLIALVAAGRLDNTYLPPSNARSSGGNSNSLVAPNKENLNYQYAAPQLSTQYLPSSYKQNYQINTPNSQYGPPEPSTQYLPSDSNTNGQNTYRDNSQRQIPKSQYEPPQPSTQYLPSDRSTNGENTYTDNSQRQILKSQYEPLQLSTQYLPSGENTNGANTYKQNSQRQISKTGNINTEYGKPELSTKYLPSNRNANEQNSQNTDGNAAALRFNAENNGDGSYKFEYETENKIKHEEVGELKNVGSQQEVTVVQGSYSYIGTDGVEYTVTYTADENGFQASGDHLPTSPPIPEEIQRSLNKIEETKHGYSSNPSEQNGYPESQSTIYQNQNYFGNQRPLENQPQEIQKTSEEKYLPPQKPGRQYLSPNTSEDNGYKY